MKSLNSYFSPDYFTARDRFRKATAKSGGRLHTLSLSAKGPGGEDLDIDVAWFGADAPRQVLLHSSGIHGVEGFAGSAIQLQLLDDLPTIPANAALVVVHILNPYGMAWLRRTNENNVDLNRNFRADGSYAGTPPSYVKLDLFLNPRTPPASDLFFAKGVCLILRYGMGALKQSVVGGQYEFPKGLFFGGKHLEEGPRKYQEFLTERLLMADKAVVLDVHTGIGRFAEDTLLVQPEDYVRLQNVFGHRVTALEPERGPAYRIEGGLQSMIFHVFSKTRPVFVGQEFGTYSGIKVLHALREENRWHHYGGGTLDHPVKKKLKKVFCPADASWREAVLKRGRELIERAIAEIRDI